MLLNTNDILAVNKEFILQRARQEEIFRRYLEMPIDLMFQFCSPLRPDKVPTCSMGYFGEKLLYRDWSEDKAMDCFDFVMAKYKEGYGRALERISKDLDLRNREPNEDLPEEFKEARLAFQDGKRPKKIIKVRVQEFRRSDVEFLKSYYITRRATKKFKCYSIQLLWLQGMPFYTYRDIDPALGYYLGDDERSNQRWKINYYKRKGKGNRFMGNTNRINGWVQLPEKGEVVIITKSMKDVMVLDMFGIPAIAMQSETSIPYKIIVDNLYERFNKIYSLYDFDRAGIRGAQKMKKEMGIPPIFLTDGRFSSRDYKCKDISDFIREYGIDNTLTLLKYAAKRLSINLDLKYNE